MKKSGTFNTNPSTSDYFPELTRPLRIRRNIMIESEQNLNSNSLENNIFASVTYITQKNPLLQAIFLRWSSLNKQAKHIFNYLIFQIIPEENIRLYTPILKSFVYWDWIQEFEGASGYHQNPLNLSLSSTDDKIVFNIILVMNKVSRQFELRAQLKQEICQFDYGRLKKRPSLDVIA